MVSACVEVNDSDSYEMLTNRSNTVVLTNGTEQRTTDNQGPLVVFPVPWVATAPLVPHDAYKGRPPVSASRLLNVLTNRLNVLFLGTKKVRI